MICGILFLSHPFGILTTFYVFILLGIWPPDNFLIFRKMGEMIQANLRDVEEQLWKQYVNQAEYLPACQRAVADPNFHCSKIHRRNRTVFFSNLI